MLVWPILPYALSFAAGAMIFIVVEEVIPESQSGGHTDLATMGLIFGFIEIISIQKAIKLISTDFLIFMVQDQERVVAMVQCSEYFYHKKLIIKLKKTIK